MMDEKEHRTASLQQLSFLLQMRPRCLKVLCQRNSSTLLQQFINTSLYNTTKLWLHNRPWH